MMREAKVVSLGMSCVLLLLVVTGSVWAEQEIASVAPAQSAPTELLLDIPMTDMLEGAGSSQTYIFDAEADSEYRIILEADDSLRKELIVDIKKNDGTPVKKSVWGVVKNFEVGKFTPGSDGRYFLEIQLGKDLPNKNPYSLKIQEFSSDEEGRVVDLND